MAEFADYPEPPEPEAGMVATPEDPTPVRKCVWNPVVENAQQKLPVIALEVHDNLGVDAVHDLGTGLRREEMASGRQLARTTRKGKGCLIAIAVSEGARVDVIVDVVEPDEACDIASRTAEIIDPKLPMG